MCVQLAHGSDSDAVRLVDNYDWYVMPVVNPDGYSFTFTDVSIVYIIINKYIKIILLTLILIIIVVLIIIIITVELSTIASNKIYCSVSLRKLSIN